MANNDRARGFFWAKSVYGSNTPVLKRDYLGSNTSCKPGDPLHFTAAGYLTVSAADTAEIAGFALETITGVAATRQYVSYVPCYPGYIFVGQADSGTAAAVSHRGDVAGFTGSSGAWEIDLAGYSDSQLIIIDKVPSSEWGSHADLYFFVRKQQVPDYGIT